MLHRVSDSPLSTDEVSLWRTLEALQGADSLLDWVPEFSPTFQRPEHLRPLAEVLTRAQYEPVYAWISVPPRHSKTETILHSVPHRMLMDPTTQVAYCTYEANLAYTKSRRMREIAEASGVQLKRGAQGVQEWQTQQGGRLIATGVGGPLTGRGCNLLIIDDPLKNREEAESPVIRQKIWDWFTSTALTRVEPGGSVIVCHTRWHDDDLIGRIQQEFPDWTGIQMPAVEEIRMPDGKILRKALWPERWNLDELDKKRRLVGEYDWSALYQGQPRPKGGRLFGSVTRYEHGLITENAPYKIIIGADPAATEKTTADFSAAVVLACKGTFGTLSFQADVLEVYRRQVTVPEFVARLNDLCIKWGAPVAVEAVGGFKAIPQMLRNLNPKLRVIEAPALGDKFTRSLPASAAWNDGRIRIPSDVRNNEWVPDFLNEVEKFTGVKDAKDDQVDALAHAFNAAQTLIPIIQTPRDLRVKSGLPFG